MDNDKIKVLVVEDEASIRKFISINLNRSGFEVLEVDSGEMAIHSLSTFSPSVVILDVMLPGIDGFEVCQKIRELKTDTAIIMLTAKSQDMDKIIGLELGSDDYMIKPFNPLELVARIRAILRRSTPLHQEPSNIVFYKNLKLDIISNKFFKNETEIILTPTEFSIMKLLLKNPNKAYSRDEILNLVWGKNYFGDVKTVDVHVRRLREKVEDLPSNPKYIETVWGIGYRLRGEK